MTSLTYAVESVPWIVAGLIVGFFLGRSTAALSAIADAVQGDSEGNTMAEPEPKVARVKRPRFTGIHVIGVALIVLGVFSAVQSYMQGEATARLTECQTVYANGFADALEARSKATSEAQDAQDELWTTVASLTPAPESREVFRAALDEYLKKRAAAKKAQAEHPFPEPPRDVCKEDGA